MTSEEDFQGMLDANPHDWQTRLIFADWLQDRGDVRAEGYRALGVMRHHPNIESDGAPYAYQYAADLEGPGRAEWWTGRLEENTSDEEIHGHTLPGDWLALLACEYPYYCYREDEQREELMSCDYFTRQEADDAAALAFAKLPAERRAELLAGQGGFAMIGRIATMG